MDEADGTHGTESETTDKESTFPGIRLSAKEWLKIKKYPKPGSKKTDKERDSLQEGVIGKPVDEWLAEIGKMTIRDLIDEYVMLKLAEEDTPVTLAPSPATKARYHGVELGEKTRVKLNDKLPGDYIHASYVDGYMQKAAYISTQAPMDDTIVDFWRLLWQEEALIVVMLTKIQEGTIKSSVYWPGRKGAKTRYGPFMVTNTSVVVWPTFTVTEMKVTELRSNRNRVVTHFLYTDWPDHCVPINLTQFLVFMEHVRKVQRVQLRKKKRWTRNLNGPPIVIHCSAGIGRTGTYETIDICFRRFIATGRLDVPETLKMIRRQRQGSVQSNEQYIFIYAVLLHLVKEVGLLNASKIDPEGMTQKW